jgi:hypothetical protein
MEGHLMGGIRLVELRTGLAPEFRHGLSVGLSQVELLRWSGC